MKLNQDHISLAKEASRSLPHRVYIDPKLKNKHSEILHFIKTIRNSFGGSKYVYTNGSCYQFYKILKLVFPQAIGYYNSDHVITKINGRYYDITGEVKETNHLLIDKYYDHKELNKLKFKMVDENAKINKYHE